MDVNKIILGNNVCAEIFSDGNVRFTSPKNVSTVYCKELYLAEYTAVAEVNNVFFICFSFGKTVVLYKVVDN